MEISRSSSNIAVSIILVGILTLAWKLGNWLWFRPKKLETYLKRQGVSGNPYRFFYGDLKKMHKQSLCQSIPFLIHLIQSYGKNSLMWIGPIPRVNIMNPEHIKDVLMKVDEFRKVKTVNPMVKLLAPGIASYEGDKWVKHRKLINPAFTLDKLKLMLPQMYESCNMMIENWIELIMSEKETSCEIDVWPYLQKMSRDIIARAAFGSNYEQGKLIFDLIEELADHVMRTVKYVYIPGWRFLPTKSKKRMKQIDKEIKVSLELMIKKRKEAMKRGEAIKDDLLGLLIEKQSDKKMGLSINDVMDECRVFYFAGQDTTSSLLVWTMILLSKYPNWEASARQEVQQVFGNSKPNFGDLNHLKVASITIPYVNMILHEVLRLYPPVVLISRRVTQETRVGNLVSPAGIEVSLPTSIIHQDCELWGDDASEFNPERFSEGLSKATKHQGAFFPFGLGPRICVGLNFTKFHF